jgi:hypothetical protein
MRRHRNVGLRVAAVIVLSMGCGDHPPTTPSAAPVTPSVMQVDSVTPTVGSTAIPTSLMIQGAGFSPGATVSVGDRVLQPSVTSQRQLIVVTPAQPAGEYALVVRNPDGQSVQLKSGFRFEANLPTDPIEVRITGQVFAGSSDVPLAGAAMQLPQDVRVPQPSVATDADGRFTLIGFVSKYVQYVQVKVTWPGMAPWTFESPRDSTDQAVFRLPGVLGIRAGATLRGAIANGPDLLWCTFESAPCLRLVVGGTPGTLVDLELIPDNGRSQGLFLEEPFLFPQSFPTRLTLQPTMMLIMGDFGAFTLKAHGASR